MPEISLFCGIRVTMFPKVLQAVAGEDFTVYLYFNDGSVRLYDAKPLLALGGVFAPLQDEAFFKSRLTVLNDTAAWDVTCLLYTSPSPRDKRQSRMPSSA